MFLGDRPMTESRGWGRRGRLIYRFVLATCLGSLLLGGFFPLLGQSYPIRVYTEADGLSSSGVYDMALAPDGRLWFATRAGVSVYDGATWRRFGLEDGLPSSGFFRLAVGGNGEVWALNHSERLLFRGFDGAWEALPPFLDVERSSLEPTDFELMTHGETRLAAVSTTRGLYLLSGNEWRRLTLGKVNALASFYGELYAATERGLVVIEVVAGRPRIVESHGTGAIHGLKSADGELWLIGERGLGRWSQGQVEWLLAAAELPAIATGPGAAQLEADGRGGVYVADRATIFHVDAARQVTPLGLREGFATPGATSLLMSPDGALWAASERGVSKLSSRRFASYSKSDGLFEDEVSAIIEKRPGILFLGHQGGLTQLVEDRPVRTLSLPKAEGSSGRVMDLVRHGQDIWVLTSDAGLWLLPAGELTALRRFGEQDESLPETLAAGLVDSQGDFWVAGKGLARLEDGRFREVPLPVGHLGIRRLALGPKGEIYATTTRRGLLIWQNDQWAVATRADGSVPSLFTVEVWRDRVWVGADEGLFFLADGRLVQAEKPRVARRQSTSRSLMESVTRRAWIDFKTMC